MNSSDSSFAMFPAFQEAASKLLIGIMIYNIRSMRYSVKDNTRQSLGYEPNAIWSLMVLYISNARDVASATGNVPM